MDNLRQSNKWNAASTKTAFALAVATLLALLSACGGHARLPAHAGTGVDPELPQPPRNLFPTVEIAPAVGWTDGATPTPAANMEVTAFAEGLDHPRWLYVLPNGDVLVAETNAPPGKSGIDGIKGWVMKQVMKRAGAAVPSANRITLLRDTDGDGKAEFRSVFLQGLHSPFGMALVGDMFYVANANALLKVPYQSGETTITAAPVKVTDLPGKGDELNHHWTKSLLASADGAHLYVGVGANSNIAENGMQVEHKRAAILEVDTATGATRVFASGLRNPVGLDWEPHTGELWAVVNERDELGSDLVPDYLTSVRRDAFYGWPYSYYGQHVDERVSPQQPELVASAISPDFALGAHVAPLGLAFSSDGVAGYGEGAFVGLHGSWNRRPLNGYEVVFVPFTGGRPVGPMETVLSGFVDADRNARGRPVGVSLDGRGGLLVADDVGNSVWRVTAARDLEL
ncbi:sorbosone dehydrogenase family protein [Marinobacter panjinensis]|uniref:Sorbosone dehydrogenase family protein n=1 Tax=Marinobacter panjinensis TaxID=2576384 RepID=A0A4U6R5U1_9GAMM|nr:sorbosone dehydrogenase family protein [Marinobacter panjinensis]MCR8914122.1 sorbosone dehydrogenase family protein [Marinobacter panjinensis]TKV69019.1 sorbosone dehydrogenase family protein [Marinobacter panjinensis]